MSQGDWYFADPSGQRQGPFREEQLARRIQVGEISATTLLWTEGLEEWTPAAELAVFEQATRPAEPEREAIDPVQKPAATLQPSLPNPFHRFLARQLDFLVFHFLVLQLAGGAQVALGVDPFVWIGSLYLIWALIEGLLLHFLGQTPGKWLMRIELSDAYGKRLSLATALRRSLDVAVRGVGLGLPYAHTIAMLFGFYQLTGRGITPWDRTHRVVVSHRPLELIRLLALVALSFALLKSNVGFFQPMS